MSDEIPTKAILVMPRLRIQNANAISSPMTHGFPSMTAFLGLMWALERRLNGQFPAVFTSIGVICHSYEEQVTSGGFVQAFRLTRNPVNEHGKAAAIVEEGRIHLTVTLLLGVAGSIVAGDEDERAEFARAVSDVLAQMRVAGGTVLPSERSSSLAAPALLRIADDEDEAAADFRRFRRQWLPGFALVSRDDLLQQRLAALRAQDSSKTELDAWLDLSRFNWKPHPKSKTQDEADSSESVEWKHDRTEGWIVPIPIGYGALSEEYPAGTVANARDPNVPFRFVESLYSVGQWVGPHRLSHWRQLLWYAHSDPASGVYRVCNDFAASV